MQIKQRLSYQFIAIVAVILILFSLSVYYFSANYRTSIYFERLSNKAHNVANLLIEVDEVDIELLKRIEQDNPVSLPHEKIIIYNYHNEVLYDSDEQTNLHVTPELLTYIRLKGEIKYKQGEYEIIGFLFTSRYDRFVVLASAIDIYGKQRLKNLLNILIIVFCVSLIILILAGNIYAKRALLPISKLIKQVNNITVNSMNLRLDEGNRTDEIAQLAYTFNQMLERLETAFKVQRNFIANASHEMRTPLTSITGQLEVLLMQKRSDKEYTDAIHSVLDDIKQMNNTSNRLLMLAQASAEVTAATLQPIRIDDLLWQARSEILKHNPDYKISIAFADWLDEAHMRVLGNSLLLNSAIANLMDNACKYSDDNACDVRMDCIQNNIVLKFSDNGIGIDEKDLANITQPFYRGKNIGAIKGHGIGLSLVEKIISMHNGTMQINSAQGKGTLVTIQFPVFSN